MARVVRTIVFGGAFDPPTKGHVAIFKQIQKFIEKSTYEDYVLKILISCNDEKTYNASFEDRKAMVQRAFELEKKYDYEIIMQEARMKDTIEKTLGILLEDAYIVIGMDQAVNIANNKWRYSQELRDNCGFLVFDRGFGKSMFESIFSKFHNIRKLSFTNADYDDGVLSMSSTKARAEMEKYPFAAYDAIAASGYCAYSPEIYKIVPRAVLVYIYQNKLYNQYEKVSYQEEEEKDLKEYKKEAKEKGWGEPSCTATILVHNSSEEILLVRRAGFPYKGYWALPGGFFELKDKNLESTAARELKEETNLELDETSFRQIKTYSHMFDPRMRIIDTGFCIGIPDELQEVVMAKDDAAEVKWFPMYDLPSMAFHHGMIVQDFLESQHNPFKK